MQLIVFQRLNVPSKGCRGYGAGRAGGVGCDPEKFFSQKFKIAPICICYKSLTEINIYNFKSVVKVNLKRVNFTLYTFITT